MNMDKKQPATKEELNDYAIEIHKLHLHEINYLANANGTNTTSDDRMSDFEDAYLANLKKIKLAKQFTEAQYDEHQLDRQCGCKFEELNIPTWEDYIG